MNRILEKDFEFILKNTPIDWKSLGGKTFLVTGAAGALPSYMVKTLLYINTLKQFAPVKVLALVRSIERAKEHYKDFLQDANLVFVEQDVKEPFEYEGSIDYIIHAASPASPKFFFSDPVGTINANTLGTYNMLKLAKEKKVKGFLYFSSGEVYGDIFEHKDLANENDYGYINPLDVRNCYAESKKLGENMCYCWNYQYGVPVKMVRPAHTYGPGFKADDGRAFATFMNAVVNNQNIVLKSDGSAKRSFIYLADAVRAYFMVLVNGENGASYNIGNNREISILEMAQIILSVSTNKDLKVVFDIPANSPSSKSSHGMLDVSKVMSLGWKPMISEEDGFRRYYESVTTSEG